MRPVLHGDVSSAARVLLGAPRRDRAALCRAMIAEADAAEAHVRSTGRLHPRWGSGTLMSAARKRALLPEPDFDDPDYCACFAIVLLAVRRHRQSTARRQPRAAAISVFKASSGSSADQISAPMPKKSV